MDAEESDRARRVTTSPEFVDLFESDPVKFVRQIVTGDETWVHHWDPESKGMLHPLLQGSLKLYRLLGNS